MDRDCVNNDNVVNRSFSFCRPTHIFAPAVARHAAMHRLERIEHAVIREIGAVGVSARTP
jgi:hypothetical protein